jgi:hypothetical protein
MMTTPAFKPDETLQRAFEQVFVSCVEDDEGREDLALTARGVEILLDLCRRAAPSRAWERIAVLEWRGDAESVLGSMEELGRDYPDADRCQLSWGTEGEEQEAGNLYLYFDFNVSHIWCPWAEEVEALLAGEGESAQAWGRWCLLTGFLGLLVLEHLRPLPLTKEAPKKGEAMLYCVGVEERPLFYIGFRKREAFVSLLEWDLERPEEPEE